ncbi:MAG TPA: 2-phospho-L-lactate transferase [Actinomycetota bacterium]|nr:2-phospho-L-lactate transferase [Actinomycetota bacterium]
MKITALAGGVGAAKLLVGLAAVDDVQLTAVVNTADDAVIYGVHVSPDVDICTYWLAGVADEDRGWGILDDTFNVVDALRALGEDTWFSLGDRDFATCILRTRRLAEGVPLHAATDEIAHRLGAPCRVIPMSNDPVRTIVTTADGRSLEFQEYFVKERSQPDIAQVFFSGIADADPAPGVLDALREADRVIVCPSNPIVSVGPILALRGVRDALRGHPEVTAVTPIVRGKALKGPADRMLRALGTESSASGVASLYADFVTRFVIDVTDDTEAARVSSLGIEPLRTNTIMSGRSRARELAHVLVTS